MDFSFFSFAKCIILNIKLNIILIKILPYGIPLPNSPGSANLMIKQSSIYKIISIKINKI